MLAPRRRFAGLNRHVIFNREYGLAQPPRRPPFTLVVSPDGHHGGLVSAQLSELFDEKGVAWPNAADDLTAFDDIVFVAGERFTWDGARGPDEYNARQTALVRRIDAKQFAAVWVGPHHAGQRPLPPSLTIEGGPRAYDGDAIWAKMLEDRGVAVIAADFTAFVALGSRKLLVFAPRRNSQGEPTLEAEHDAGMVARWISLTDAHVVLLAAEGAATRLRAFTLKAAPVYTLTVPFEVLQPAIAGAAKRVYLAGKGLAAIDDGKLAWSHPSEEPLYVSSFEDGSLAVARGKRLEFVKTDGSIDQTFDTEEPLVAPPAITGDGSVWAASATALYIAR